MSDQKLAERPLVLVTDYQWPNIDREREILAAAGAGVVVAPDSTSEQLRALAGNVTAIMTCWAQVRAEVLESAPGCVVVARAGAGLDNIDVDRATELGIVVTNVPDYCVDEVAEHAMALMLASVRRVCDFDAQTRAGRWDNKAAGPIHRLHGQTLGLVGYGRIARAVATRARAFGMTVAAYQRSPLDAQEPRPDISCASLAELLAVADVVSVHVPLTPLTAGMIGEAEFAQMKPGALLVNTARGALIDFAALRRALATGALGGAALDVLAAEPPPDDELLVRGANLILTPHAGFYSEEALADLQVRTAQSIAQCLQGELPSDIANPAVLDNPRLRLVSGAASVL